MSNDMEVRSRSGISGLVFAGCLLIGLAAGIYTNNVAIALIGALGVGFIVMAMVRALTGQW
jgi:hypothetical protein